MYIQYFLVTFSYYIVLINGINFTEDVHTDSLYLHFGLISIFVLLFHMGLDKCVWDVTCCDISTFLCFDHFCTNGQTCYFIMLHICMLCASIRTMSGFRFLSLFSVKNRSDSIALCLSDLLSKHLWTGLIHGLSYSYFISL